MIFFHSNLIYVYLFFKGDSNSNRLRESSSIANNVVIPASPINQQQIETISSVTEGIYFFTINFILFSNYVLKKKMFL